MKLIQQKIIVFLSIYIFIFSTATFSHEIKNRWWLPDGGKSVKHSHDNELNKKQESTKEQTDTPQLEKQINLLTQTIQQHSSPKTKKVAEQKNNKQKEHKIRSRQNPKTNDKKEKSQAKEKKQPFSTWFKKNFKIKERKSPKKRKIKKEPQTHTQIETNPQTNNSKNRKFSRTHKHTNSKHSLSQWFRWFFHLGEYATHRETKKITNVAPAIAESTLSFKEWFKWFFHLENNQNTPHHIPKGKRRTTSHQETQENSINLLDTSSPISVIKDEGKKEHSKEEIVKPLPEKDKVKKQTQKPSKLKKWFQNISDYRENFKSKEITQTPRQKKGDNNLKTVQEVQTSHSIPQKNERNVKVSESSHLNHQNNQNKTTKTKPKTNASKKPSNLKNIIDKIAFTSRYRKQQKSNSQNHETNPSQKNKNSNSKNIFSFINNKSKNKNKASSKPKRIYQKKRVNQAKSSNSKNIFSFIKNKSKNKNKVSPKPKSINQKQRVGQTTKPKLSLKEKTTKFKEAIDKIAFTSRYRKQQKTQPYSPNTPASTTRETYQTPKSVFSPNQYTREKVTASPSTPSAIQKEMYQTPKSIFSLNERKKENADNSHPKFTFNGKAKIHTIIESIARKSNLNIEYSNAILPYLNKDLHLSFYNVSTQSVLDWISRRFDLKYSIQGGTLNI